MRFIADGMLGKLTRWLRMLGHDVHYYRSMDDLKLIELSKSDERVLLTRDLKLYRQAITQDIEAAFIKTDNKAENLMELASRFCFELNIDPNISRCPICNAMITPVSKELVINQIPESTAVHYDMFWNCPRCGKVYWQGAHWKQIEKTLKEANSKLIH